MIKLLSLVLLLGYISCRPVNNSSPHLQPNIEEPNLGDTQILSYVNENLGEGVYHFSYTSSDGTWRDETLTVKNLGTAEQEIEIKGQYSYIDPEGKTRNVQYIGDSNGYRIEESGIKLPDVLYIPSAAIASLAGGGLG